MKIENLDHLGLVSGIVDELGLVELTNGQLSQRKLEHISAGQVVKALILNGLGFVSAPLYLFSEFFESKPVEHLLGAGVKAEHLNDDRLGRVLDQLNEEGTSSFFLRAALQAVERFDVGVSQVHLDSSSFSLQGEYERDCVEPGDLDQLPIEICRGYSRDQRPDSFAVCGEPDVQRRRWRAAMAEGGRWQPERCVAVCPTDASVCR